MFPGLGFLPGLNFGRMNLTSEAISKLLNEKNTTVEDLLKEEELLQEFRSQNQKLIDFFDKDKVKHLLDYIIKEQEDEQNKGYKFPFLCSQIFGLEIDKIMNYFFMTNKQIKEEEEKREKEKKENEKDSDSDDNSDNDKKKEEKENKEKNEKDNDNKKEENEKNEKEKNEENKNNEDKKEEKIENKENEQKESSKKEDENKEQNKNVDEKKDDKDEKKEEVKNNDKKKEEIKLDSTKEIKEDKKEENKQEEKKEEKKEDKKEEEKKEDKKEEVKKEEEKKEEEKKEDKKEEENKKEREEENEEEKEEPESTENKIELLDYFFTFFPEDDKIQLNYVLSGYFSSLVINLLSLNAPTFLKYIYLEKSDVLDKMVAHCYRKSIADTLSKILHFENYFQNEPLDENTKNDMIAIRKSLFKNIFDKIDINMENEDLNSIYFLVTGLFDPTNIHEEKDIFKELIDNKFVIRALVKKTLENLDLISFTKDNDKQVVNRRKNFMVIADIIIYFLTNIKKLKLDIPIGTSESKLTINHTTLSDELFNILDNLIKNNFNKKNEEEKPIMHSFNDCQIKPLGEYKIKIVDLLCYLVPYFKSISKFYDEILIENEFFKYAFDYLFEYEWNNIYQDSLLSLLRELLNEANDHQLLQDHLINNFKLFEVIKTHTNEEDKFKITETNSITHGYYSFLISLSYKLNTVMGGATVIMKNAILRQGSFTFIAKVPEEGDKRAAMDMLYGGLDDLDNNENEDKGKEEEKPKNYEIMQKYINDDWRNYFEEKIVKVITQYENKDWPEENKNTPFDRATDEIENENLEKKDEEEGNKRENNIFGNDEDNNDENNEDRGRAGVRDAEVENFFGEEKNDNEEGKDNDIPLDRNNVNIDDFVFDNKNENDEKNPFKNQDIKENDFEFEDQKKDEKKEEKQEEKEKENNENKTEEKKEELENKPEDKKEENKKEEEKKEETKPEGENEKKEEKVEETKKEDDKKEDNKVGQENKEEEKKEKKDEEYRILYYLYHR